MPGCSRALVVTRMFTSYVMWVHPVCTTFKNSGRVRDGGKLASQWSRVRNSLKGFHGGILTFLTGIKKLQPKKRV